MSEASMTRRIAWLIVAVTGLALAPWLAIARLGYGGAMAQELAGLGDQDLIDLAHFLSHQR